MQIYIDFETYSELDVTDVGSWVYSRHPSTQILCLSWRVRTGEHGIWINPDIPGDYVPLRRLFNKPALDRLFVLIADRNNTVEAHNVFFEKCIWWNIGQGGLFWPDIEEHQWRCSAAKAAACALPRELGDAGRALRLADIYIKDEAGRRIMLKLSRTGKGTKEEWEALYDYCEQDTAAEMHLSLALPELSPKELRVWQTDQRMNLRAIPCDVEGARKAARLAEAWTEELNTELDAITNGQVSKATQIQRLVSWLQTRGVNVYDGQANTLDLLLPILSDGVEKRAVQIRRSVGRSSIGKYEKLIDSSENGLMHDTQMYHGATTGRWTAKRFQPHNLPRGGIKDMDFAWKLIHAEDLEMIRLLFGDPMEFLSHALRGVVQSNDGKTLHCGDYSAIETRILFWIAQELKALAIIASGEDIYLDMASEIYGRKITKDDSQERQLGKQAILGLGFGMGYVKYLQHCRTYKMKFTLDLIRSIVPEMELRRIATWIKEEDWERCERAGMTVKDLPELCLMKFIVDRYRAKYKKTVCQLWRDVENAAKAAMREPGKMFVAGRTGWHYDNERFLTAQLPSRRRLYYPFPALDENGLTFMGVDSITHQWVRERTYGGKLTENIVQATARDIMAEAMIRCEDSGEFDLLMLVHDEVVAESQEIKIDKFTSLISEIPEWAYGLPVKAESWAGKRYRK